MGHTDTYVIRGGVQGRERLRLLSRVMATSTGSLFDRLPVRDGWSCLDVGCGGGDASLELARRVGPSGKVVATDIDETKLEIARTEAGQQRVSNVEFRLSDVRDASRDEGFDLVYARFLLTHLSDPAAAVASFYRRLNPGGVVAVEDIDFTGYFTYPESAAFSRYLELYRGIVRPRGGDPNIGPRLPLLLRGAGFREVGMCCVQHLGMEGEVKLINPITMENIADVILKDGLSTREELDRLIRELYELAADPDTVAGTPRIVQAWGRRPAVA